MEKNVKFTVFDGGLQPVEYNLWSYSKNRITFGRAADNDIVIHSTLVSHHHGFIVHQNGQWMIQDNASTNGLKFAGKKFVKHSLQDGDTIQIGDASGKGKSVMMLFSRQNRSQMLNRYDLSKKEVTTIGRDRGNDICLAHVSVSKFHARIIRTGQGYCLYDNNSTNGTMVNGKRIRGKYYLQDNDIILITNTRLIYAGGSITYTSFAKGLHLSARHIVKKVPKTICNDVSFDINPCELVAIIGGSGAGKSTIMNCVCGYSVPTDGNVYVNDMNLYQNYDALKNIIGYVPQSDIVYDNLTVERMLDYAARLRLPADTQAPERARIVAEAIEAVELTEHKKTMIGRLSGGQKKRASIAVELLSDPKLFFLDEPASGLDPGTERNLMRTLKKMAANGKTVILVTHSTLNLQICDKILFMGQGGNLCFCGSYQEALQFFGVKDIVDIYTMLNEQSETWKERYRQYRQIHKKGGASHAGSMENAQKKKNSIWHQFLVLSQRYGNLLLNDRQRLLIIFLLAPVLTFLITMVADGEQFNQYEMTKSLLFALACSAFFIGTLNSIQEVCKERIILRREYMTGLSLTAYILSKVFILGCICLLQSLLSLLIFKEFVGIPEKGVLLSSFAEFWITTFLTEFAAVSMGIFVSSIVKNPDRATTMAPILLMPQILFSGLVFSLEGATKIISWFAVCRWSMEGYGTTANLNGLDLKLQQENIPIEHEAEDFFTYTTAHMLKTWMILIIFVVVFSAAAGVALRNIKKENR